MDEKTNNIKEILKDLGKITNLEYILTRMLKEKTNNKKDIGEYNKEGIKEYNEGDKNE